MNLWEQYNPRREIGDAIAERYRIVPECNGQDTYAVVKRHLTRRELRCFVMREGGRPIREIAGKLKTDEEGARTLVEKIDRKFRRPLLTEALRRCGDVGEDATPGR